MSFTIDTKIICMSFGFTNASAHIADIFYKRGSSAKEAKGIWTLADEEKAVNEFKPVEEEVERHV